MKVKFDRRKIADNCTYLAYVLIIIISFLGILAIADGIFHWNILSERLEKLAYLFIWASMVIILGAFLISLMVNISIISQSMESLSERMLKENDHEAGTRN